MGCDSQFEKFEGSASKPLQVQTNPKDLIGSKKVSISKTPLVSLLHLSHAMMNGASKYGPYNWRGNPVQADIYIDAAIRHLGAWFDSREEVAEDSGVHHLGHAMACCAILLDAQATGNLVDNRPENGKFNEIAKQLNEVIKKRSENA